MAKKKQHNQSGADQLRSVVERIERLEEEKAAVAADIKEVYAEAKANGFDTKTLRKLIVERRKDRAQREEEQALLEIYMAALGMLDGTPLGDAARKRLTDEDEEQPDAEPDETAEEKDGEGDGGGHIAPERPARSSPVIGEQELENARGQGREAARDGKRVIDNPFVAGDPRRAAWDEGWCAQTGSDGMDIPEAWRRKKKPKPAKYGDGKEGGDA